MPKKSRVRTLMDSQDVKKSERLLESPRHFFGHIFLSLWREISPKNSFLVVSDTRWQVFSLTQSESLTPPIQMILSQNQKIFSEFFAHFRNLHKIWNPFKKIWASEVISFWNYRLQKVGLLKSLKSLLSEHLWRVNMFKGAKCSSNMHGSIFVIFFDHFERKSTRKALF